MGLHVRQGLQTDNRPHDGDNQDHDQRQVISVKGGGGGMFRSQAEKVQSPQDYDLQDGEDLDGQVVVLKTEVEYDQQQKKVGDFDDRKDR